MSGNEEKEKKKGMFGRLFGGAKDKEIVDVPVAANEDEERDTLADETTVLEANEDVASS